MTLTLYSMPSSGNSYKVRLLLAYLGLPCTHVGLEYETPDLAKAHANRLLPMGKLPVLELEDGTQLAESNAILCYLAENTVWFPGDRLARARVLQWMFFEQNRHEPVIAVRAALRTYESRRHLATPERMRDLLDAGHAVLRIMENHLATEDWLAGPGPTIADISLYAYSRGAGPKGGFEMTRFPGVCDWLDRVAGLPGHVVMETLAE